MGFNKLFKAPSMPAITKTEQAPVTVSESDNQANQELDNRKKRRFGLSKTVTPNPGTLLGSSANNPVSGAANTLG